MGAQPTRARKATQEASAHIGAAGAGYASGARGERAGERSGDVRVGVTVRVGVSGERVGERSGDERGGVLGDVLGVLAVIWLSERKRPATVFGKR